MADQHCSSKRKYYDPSPPPRRTRFFDRPLPASTPAGGAPASSSSHNMPPPASPSSRGVLMPLPLNDPEVAKQRVHKVADSLLMGVEVNSPRVDKDVVGAGGSLGGSGRIGGGGLGFSSSAGGADDDNSTERTSHTDGLMKEIPVPGSSSQHGYYAPHPQANWGAPGPYLGMAQYGHQSYANSFAPGYNQTGWDPSNQSAAYYQQNSGHDSYDYYQWQQQQAHHRPGTAAYASESSFSATESQYVAPQSNQSAGPYAYTSQSYQQNSGHHTHGYFTYPNQWQQQDQYQHTTAAYASASDSSASESQYVTPHTYASYSIQPQLHSGYGQVPYGFGHDNYSQPSYGVPPPCSQNYNYPVYGQQQSCTDRSPSASTSAPSAPPPAHGSSDVYKIDAKTLDKAMSVPGCIKIGAGAFGTVYKVRFDGKDVAVKIFNCSCPTSDEQKQVLRQFNDEVKVLNKVQHANLVKFIASCEERLAIVYEYMPNGNLQDKIMALGKNFKWRQRVQVAIDICRALIHMHEGTEAIVHGDISPGNILFDTTNVAKLSDFGLSRTLEKLTDSGTLMHATSHTPMGTPGYVDPEYQRTRKLTKFSDNYSFGVILLTLVTGQCDEFVRKTVHDSLVDGPFWDLNNPKMTRNALKHAGVIERHLYIAKKNLLDVLEILKLGLRLSGRTRHKRPKLTEVLPALVSYRDAIQMKANDEE